MKDYKHFESYKKLRDSIDSLADALTGKHTPHMKCKKACDLCCMDYSILPLEFHYIQRELRESGYVAEPADNLADSNGCKFLKNHLCTIYPLRPVICRTHGLPLLYTNDDYEWELSTCELNFTDFDYALFTPENTFPQDRINSRLFMLNKQFISEFRDINYGELDRGPMKLLTD